MSEGLTLSTVSTIFYKIRDFVTKSDIYRYEAEEIPSPFCSAQVEEVFKVKRHIPTVRNDKI